MADEPTTILDDLTALAESLRVAGDERHERMAAAVVERVRATPQADRLAIKMLVAAGFVTEEKANDALNIAHGFQPGPLAATPQAEPDTDSADFKKGFAVGRAEAESLAASIKHPACAQCGATCAKDAAAKCRPSGDSCPGVEWPLADLWALQQPATPQAAQVPLLPCPVCGGEAIAHRDKLAGISINFRPPSVPEGYALVPVEPTRDMIEAGIMFGTSPNKAAIIWQSMVIAAAQAQGVANG